MIVMLDDIGKALYKKLKTESDNLSRIRVAIKYKRVEVDSLFDQWIELEGLELDDDADLVYSLKLKVEREIANLERQEQESLRKINVYAKNRSA